MLLGRGHGQLCGGHVPKCARRRRRVAVPPAAQGRALIWRLLLRCGCLLLLCYGCGSLSYTRTLLARADGFCVRVSLSLVQESLFCVAAVFGSYLY